MISQLTGKITYKGDNFIIIDASSVGYKVFVPNDTIKEIDKLNTSDKKTTLWTHLAVRENSMDLFGFLTKEDLDFFELLISISGIGPKTALGVFSAGTRDEIIKATIAGDVEFFEKVPRLGRKNAQKIIIELKSKFGDLSDIDLSDKDKEENNEVILALRTFGFSTNEARDAIKNLKDAKTLDEKIKQSLRYLGK